MFKHCIVFLVSFFYLQIVNAQCSFIGPEIIAHNTTRFFNLDIAGATNNDLSSPTQGICAVIIDFQHPMIGDLSIRLISPSNDTITLVGPFGVTNFTNLSRWNVSFFPCAIPSDPDPGFSGVWNNLQNWGQFGYFEGAYHPSNLCLEDFDTGPVNGTWQLQFINNYPFDVPVNSAILHDFTIIFCDPSGLDCEICLAKGGALKGPNGVFCEGDEDLLLDIDLEIIGVLPEEDDYDYVYLITHSGNLIDTMKVPDLRTFPPGNYNLCGLSYNKMDIDLLPIIGEPLSTSNLRNSLRSNMPPFCGSVSSSCLSIEIAPHADSLLLKILLCPLDTLFVEGDTITATGDYLYNMQASNGCDSIILYQVNRLDIQATLTDPGLLICNDSVLLALENMLISPSPDSIIYEWSDEQNILIGTEEQIYVFEPGTYTLDIISYYNGVSCSHALEVEVLADFPPYDIELFHPDTLCKGSEIILSIENPIPETYEWTIVSGNATIENTQESSMVILQLAEAGDIEFCVKVIDPCSGLEIEECYTIHVSDIEPPDLVLESIYCNLEADILISGSSNIMLLSQLSGNGTFQINYQDPDQLVFQVSDAGAYRFSLSGDFGTCEYRFDFDAFFLPSPFPSVIEHSQILCEPDTFVVSFEFPEGFQYTVYFEINGELFQFSLLEGGNQQVFIPYDILTGTVRLVQYEFLDFPECSEIDDLLLDLTLYPLPTLIIPKLDTICNSPEFGNSTLLDFSSFFNGNMNGVILENLDNVGVGNLPIIDFQDVMPGLYRIAYSWQYELLCSPLQDTILIRVLDCECPEVLSQDFIEICSDNMIDLSAFEMQPTLGWRIISRPAQSTLILSGKNANFAGQPEGDYFFEVEFEPGYISCSRVDTLHIHVDRVFQAGILVQDTVYICFELDSVINLNDYITGGDLGRWSFLGNGSLPPGAFDSITGGLISGNLAKGIYPFKYHALETDRCTGDSLLLYIAIEARAFEDLVADITIGCNTPYAEFNIFLDTAEYTAYWTVLDGEYIVQDPNSFEIIIDKAGRFQLVIENKRNGCRNTEWFTIVEIDNPIEHFDVVIQDPLCPGESTGIITIENIIGGKAPFEFGIEGVFGSNPQFDQLSPGLYNIEVVDNRGCRFAREIRVNPAPNYEIWIRGKQDYSAGEIGQFSVETTLAPQNILSTTWFFDNEQICMDCSTLELEMYRSGLLRVEMISDKGCIYTTVLFLSVDTRPLIFIPGAFTPNGDGLNDQLLVFSPDPNLYVHRMEIFDRWGNSMYVSEAFYARDMIQGWDGSYKGQELQPAVFVLYLEISRPGYEREILHAEILLAK
jgi:gliding motility-associated-like protein